MAASRDLYNEQSSADRESVFVSLRRILQEHSTVLSVGADTSERFCLEAPVGPATLAAWGGKARRETIPVAWVERRRSYVSYHLMGLAENAKLLATVFPALTWRMQRKACFNFRDVDAGLFAELEAVTASAIADFRRAGFIAI